MSALTRHSGIAACVSKTSVRGFPSFWPVQLRWNTYAPKVGWTPYGMAFFSPSRLDAANYLGLRASPLKMTDWCGSQAASSFAAHDISDKRPPDTHFPKLYFAESKECPT